MSDVVIAGDTSGSITLRSPAVSGSSVLTLPVATDTLVGKATTDTLTNKTLTAPTITGVTTVAAGSAAAPSIVSTTGTADTGQWFPAADTIAYSTAGTERMRITSGGYVGIATTAPSAVLEIAHNGGSTYGTALQIKTTSGTDGPRAAFEYYNGGTPKRWNIGIRNSSTAFGIFEDGYADAFGTERLTVLAGGNLLVGTTSNLAATTMVSILSTGDGSRTQVGNGYAGHAFGNTSGTGNYNALLFYNNNFASLVGYISVSGSTTSYVTVSDYRLKNTIAPMTGALDKVALLKPCTYKWNVDGLDGQGFIAHELAEVVPGCVTGKKDGTREEEYEISPAVPATFDADGKETAPAAEAIKGTRTIASYQGVDTSFLVATLTAAIQEQQAMIEKLTARITALETT